MLLSCNHTARRVLLALLVVSVLLTSGCATRTNNKLHNVLVNALGSDPDINAAEQALKEGADPNSTNYKGDRPLYAAFGSSVLYNDFNQKLFDLLVSYGADVSLSLKEGEDMPALFAATSYEAVKAVLDAGGDISQRNAKGDTALHHPVFFKSPAAIRLLINRGGDPTLANDKGLSAIQAVTVRRDSHKQALTASESNSFRQANHYRNVSIRMERVLAAMEQRDFDAELIASQYPPIDDNRLEQASVAVIHNNSGEYLSPYTSDGVTAEWVNQAINAGIGAQVGTVTGAATASVVAEQFSDSFAAVALAGMAGSAIGEAIGRRAAIEASGGWEHIRATSDMSFNSLADMARYLRLKHGNDENFDEVFTAIRQVYPDLAN